MKIVDLSDINQGHGRPNRDGSIVNAVEPKKSEKRECYNCGKQGHISVNCQGAKKKSFDLGKRDTRNKTRMETKKTPLR
jgi:hypothetical protein